MVTKTVKTERINVNVSTMKNIKLNVDVQSNGLAPFDNEKNIHVSLSASGTVIVHECNEIFMRSDSIKEIKKGMIDGTEYTTIIFN